MNEEEFLKWIESLNPITIRVDESGNPHPDDIEVLGEEIAKNVDEIRQQQQVEQEES